MLKFLLKREKRLKKRSITRAERKKKRNANIQNERKELFTRFTLPAPIQVDIDAAKKKEEDSEKQKELSLQKKPQNSKKIIQTEASKFKERKKTKVPAGQRTIYTTVKKHTSDFFKNGIYSHYYDIPLW